MNPDPTEVERIARLMHETTRAWCLAKEIPPGPAWDCAKVTTRERYRCVAATVLAELASPMMVVGVPT